MCGIQGPLEGQYGQGRPRQRELDVIVHFAGGMPMIAHLVVYIDDCVVSRSRHFRVFQFTMKEGTGTAIERFVKSETWLFGRVRCLVMEV